MDFFTVPTVMFKVLFVFVVLAPERRRLVHINVTDAAAYVLRRFPTTAPRRTTWPL